MTILKPLALAATLATAATSSFAQEEGGPDVTAETEATEERSCAAIMTDLEEAVIAYTSQDEQTAAGAMTVADAYRTAIDEIPVYTDNSSRCGNEEFGERLHDQANLYANESTDLLFEHKLFPPQLED